jgi:hypothetical protein
MEESSPRTPPARRRSSALLQKAKSTEKIALPESQRLRPDFLPVDRWSRPEPAEESSTVSSTPEVADDVVISTVDRLMHHGSADEKYWSQIRYAYRLLSESISAQLEEQVGRAVAERVFREVISSHEVDRLNALTMLAVLRELVSRSDAEMIASTRPPTFPAVKAKRRHEDGSLACDDDEGYNPPAAEDEATIAAVAALSIAVAPAPSSPVPRQNPLPASPPFRPSTSSRVLVARTSSPPCTPQRPVRRPAPLTSPGSLLATPEAIRRTPATSVTLSPDLSFGFKGEDAIKRQRLRTLGLPPTPSFPFSTAPNAGQ